MIILKKRYLKLLEVVPEEVLELKYPQSYQATFGGTLGTVHMTGEEWCLCTSIMGASL
jgi:hypothetical protein